MPFGVTRLVNLTARMTAGDREARAAELRSFLANQRHVTTMLAELARLDELGQVASAAEGSGTRPPVVLSAGVWDDPTGRSDPSAMIPRWHALHAAGSTGSRRVLPTTA